jgi:hypothetical protein
MTELLFNRDVRVELTDRDDPSDQVIIEDPGLPGKEPIKITFQVDKQLSTEPNRAFIEIYNLADSTAARINFRKPILEFNFGRKVDLFAGYQDRAKKIFSGVVISAITSREGPVKITRIEARNIFYELMQLPITRTFAVGELKQNAVLSILGDIGATIEGKAKAKLIERLAGEVFKDTLTIKGTAYNVINQINRGLLGVVNVYFDDIGASFNPIGIPLDEPPTIYDATLGQIIGTPEPTEIGANFVVPLDNDLRLSSPVILLSDTIQAFFASGRFVVKTATHVGSNRADGPFQTRASAVFDRTNQSDTTAIAV